MPTPPKRYHATLDRNGTEDEITIYTPEGRPMLCVGFWDAYDDEDLNKPDVDQLKADAVLIVEALNTFEKARRWRRTLNAAEHFLRSLTYDTDATPELRNLHRRVFNALCS
jgi:hypothetical protein